jgi:hypothetical protein
MAHITADRVKETTRTTGTGSMSLDGASVGYRAFENVCANNDTCYYCVVSQTGSEWEVGLATFITVNTLQRTTVHSSSNAGSLVDFSAGTKDIFLALTSTQFNANTLPTQTGNSGKFLTTNGTTGVWTSTLPVANGGTGTANGSITGTGALTITAGGTNNNLALSASDQTLNTISNGANVLINTGKGYMLLGSKTYTSYGFLKINGDFNVGPGKSLAQQNAVLGKNALNSYEHPSSAYTVAIGPNALELCTSTSFDVAIGSAVLARTTNSSYNTGVGGAALSYLESGSRNTAVGSVSLGRITSGSYNVAVGFYAGVYQANNTEPASFDNCTLIGYETKVNTANDSNSIVIGYQAVGKGSNSTVIGNTSSNAAWIYGNTLNLGNGASAAAITANGALTVTAGGTNQDVTLAPSGTGKVNAPAIKETVFAITDGGSVDINPANGGIQTWTLGANRTPTASSFAEGQSVTLMIDDGTAYAITWSSVSPTWIGGSAPTLATSGYTVIELWKRSSTIYGALVGTA